MSNEAIQVSLQSLHFDRATFQSMRGYVIGLTQRNIDGEAQLYVSQSSFVVRRDGRPKTRDDEVYGWQGDGEVIFSSALDGLERIGLDLYFIRDNANVREFGEILGDVFASEGELGKQLGVALTAAAAASGGAAAPLLKLLPPAARFVGQLLEKKRDKVKVRADGSLRTSTLLRDFALDPDSDNDLEVPWGVRRPADGKIARDADKGYFITQWSKVTSAKPEARVVDPKLPAALLARFVA